MWIREGDFGNQVDFKDFELLMFGQTLTEVQ